MTTISYAQSANQAPLFARGIFERRRVSVRLDQIVEALDFGEGQFFCRYGDGEAMYVDYAEAERVGLM